MNDEEEESIKTLHSMTTRLQNENGQNAI